MDDRICRLRSRLEAPRAGEGSERRSLFGGASGAGNITKLLGPAKWTYSYLYVMLDVFSRYVVGWIVAHGGRHHGRAVYP
jgi:transposase InsO family protein